MTRGSKARTTFVFAERRGDLLVFRRTVADPPSSLPTQSDDVLYTTDLSLVRDGDVQKIPNDGALQFPLTVGKTWEHAYTEKFGGREFPKWLKVRVAARESLTVPAGTFEVFRLEALVGGGSPANPSGTAQWKYWYAPRVKFFVKFEADSPSPGYISELTGFKIAR